MHGNRDVVSDRAVGSVFVVVSTPIFQLFTSVGKVHEPMRVQALGPELAVERLDEAVVRGLAGPREVQRDIVGIGPKVEVSRHEFAAVIDANGLRIADPATDLLQRLLDVLAAVSEAGIGRRT